jgi:2-polyprenyl-3-methyl-5-hydroxy-6-metoxy-1,4-benzoquinol methylase
VDFSLPLLREAETQPERLQAKFLAMDLTKLAEHGRELFTAGMWSVVTMFAVLHHIPSVDLRLGILQTVRQLISDDGKFILSNWQFLNSERLKRRIQPWEAASLSGSQVDPGDYLLDWRSGGTGLRYVHHFAETDLAELARASGFRVAEAFDSDGDTGNLSLYQVWVPNSGSPDFAVKEKPSRRFLEGPNPRLGAVRFCGLIESESKQMF